MSPLLAYEPMGALITVGSEAADAIAVTVQLIGPNGKGLTHRASVRAYLSDDAHGDSVVATEPSGAITAGVSGLIVPILTGAAAAELAKTHLSLTSGANGKVDISLTNVGAKTVYLILVLPNGGLVASGAITWV